MSSIETNRPCTVVAFGELLWDIIKGRDGRRDYKLGGAPGNFCFRLSKLGTPARLVTRVGSDDLGVKLIDEIRPKGLDLSLVQKDDTLPTGTVDVELNDEGNPRFVINPGVAYDNLQSAPELDVAVRSCSLLYFGTLVQRSPQTRSVVYKAIENAPQAIKFLDINLRKDCYSSDTVRGSLERTNILKLNEKEVGLVGDLLGWGSDLENTQLVERLNQTFPNIDTIVITLGADGVEGYALGQQPIKITGVTVDVSDTIGSGDSFSAGFVHALLMGEPLARACRYGNLMGALTAKHPGGMPDISDSTLAEFVSQYS